MELFEDFANWALAGKVYFGVAVFSTVMLLFQILLTIFGLGHHDVHSDVSDTDHELSGVGGITFFSFRSIVAFFCFFGWVGFLCFRSGVWSFFSFFFASLSGIAAFLAVALLLHFFYRMAVSGTVDIKDAIDEIGTVYLTIPEGKNITGAVNVKAGGALREYKAISEDGQEIKTGERVHVTGLLDPSTLIVRPLERPSDWMEKGL